MRAEIQANEQALRAGAPEDWQEWWSERGERELRCILMTAWDPVGAGDTPEAWDEYDSYMAGIAHRLRDTGSDEDAVEGVAVYLNNLERDYMDAPSAQRERTNAYLAGALVAWHEWSFARGGRPPHEWIDD